MSSFLKNIYIQALAGTLVTILFIFLYDKFEKKDFTKVEYVKFACLSYISCLASLYVSMFFSNSSNCPMVSTNVSPVKMSSDTKSMTGGGLNNNLSKNLSNNLSNNSSNSSANNNIMNDINNLERFKTGNPGF
tara:strand:- start:105 stop:503 length:399 start_codon:yes stop_codon:yes gene_type:complete